MTNTNQELLWTSWWHIWHGSHVLLDPGNKSSLQTYVGTLTLQILYFIFKKVTSFSFPCFLQNYCAQLLKFFNLGQTHEIGFEILTFGIWEMSIDKFNWDTHIWQQCLEFFLLSSISISVLILGPPLSPSWPSSSNWTPSFVSLSKLWESASILFRSDNVTQPTLLGILRRGRWLFLGESVGCDPRIDN